MGQCWAMCSHMWQYGPMLTWVTSLSEWRTEKSIWRKGELKRKKEKRLSSRMLNKAIMKRAMCSHVGPCGPFWVMYLSTNQFCRFCGKIFHISGFQFCRFCDLSTNQFCRFCRAMCSHVGLCGPLWIMYLYTNQFCRFCDLSTNQFCRFCGAMCSHMGLCGPLWIIYLSINQFCRF